MPTIPSIRTSVENKNVLVLDEHAKNGTFRKDARGRLIAYSGGFSVVFPYEAPDGTMWAFRCWHSDINNTQKRYEIISDAIKKANLPFLGEFNYIKEGINVEGIIYPTTRMRWINGITIKDYICKNKYSKELLDQLAENFLKMTQALHEKSLAHGDLQHGNILVDNNHQLFLVDYDSFYCPKLNGEEDTVTGLPDYQHPARINNKSVSEKLDYFSELIIYLSIRAIAEAPSLVDKYKVEDADRLLFSKEDYLDLKNSAIYADIIALGDDFKDLLSVLERYLKAKSIDLLEPFDQVLLGCKIVFKSSLKKVIRDKQQVVISWLVSTEAEVKIKESVTNKLDKVDTKGRLLKTLSEDTTFVLIVRLKGGKIVKREILIRVFDECVIEFSADKYHVFPSIPVSLYWNVKNAKKVWLDGEEVEAVGSKVVEPTNAVSYVLSAKDEFGKKSKRIDIGMLPIPQVKSLLVPTPRFVSKLSVVVKQPRYNVDVKFPAINLDWIKVSIPKVEIPKVMAFTDLGLNVELSFPLPKVSLIGSVISFLKNVIKK